MSRTSIIMLLVFSLLLGCIYGTDDFGAKISDDIASTSTIISNFEIEEDASMKREFCKVEKHLQECFVLKNLSNELYYIDNSFKGSFKVGDNVLLLYSERSALENGGYTADVCAIYAVDYTIHYPGN